MPTSNATDYFTQGAAGLDIVNKPVNKTPAIGETVGTQKPEFSADYLSLYGIPMKQAQFFIYTSDGNSIVQQSGILVAALDETIESWVPPTELALATDYQWNCEYQSVNEETPIKSDKTLFSVPSATVGTTTITSPVDGISASLDITIETIPFIALGAAQAHDATTVEVATDSGFNTIVDTVIKTTGDLTVIPVTLLLPDTEYFIRARHSGATTGYGGNSATLNLTSIANQVTTPTIDSPANGSQNHQDFVTLQSSIFAYEGSAQTQDFVEWVGYTDEALTNSFWSSGIISTDFNVINATDLAEGTSYWFVKRDSGNLSGFSNFSPAIKITTASKFADWLAWDRSADGLVHQVGTTEGGQIPANGLSAYIGNGKHLVISNSVSGPNVGFKIVSTLGLQIAVGSETLIAKGEPGNGVRVVRLADNKVFFANMEQTVNTIWGRVITITGSTLSFGTAYEMVGQGADHSEEWDVAGIDSENVVICWSNNSPEEPRAAIASISGDVVTFGTPLTVPNGSSSNNFERNGTISVRGNKILMVFDNIQPTPDVMMVHVLEANLSTKVITISAQEVVDVANGNIGVLTTAWVDDVNFVVGFIKADFRLYMVTGEYNGAGDMNVTFAGFVGDAVYEPSNGLAIAPITPTQIMMAYKDKSDDYIKVVVSTLYQGSLFSGEPVTLLNPNETARSSLYGYQLTPIDANKIMFTWMGTDGSSANDGVRVVIFNGEVQ